MAIKWLDAKKIQGSSTAGAFDTCTGFNNEYDPSTGDGNLRATKIEATVSGTVTSLSCDLETATGNITLGLYDDDSGVPDVRLGYTASTACVAGVNTISLITPVSITSGTDYWISFEASASVGIKLTFGQPSGTTYYQSHTYGVPPDPFGSASAHTTGFQLCLVSTGTDDKATLVTTAGAGWSNVNNVIASDELQWEIEAADQSYYDIQTKIGESISDTSWVLRFKFATTTVERGTNTDFGFLGLSSQNVATDVAQEFMGFSFNSYNNYNYDAQATATDNAALEFNQAGSDDPDSALIYPEDTWTTSYVKYWEIIRNGDVVTMNVYPDSTYDTAEATFARTQTGITGLRYFLLSGTTGRSSQSQHMAGSVDDIYFWNGVTTAGSIASADWTDSFVNSSNLPENTIFNETDTYNQYWLQSGKWEQTTIGSWSDNQTTDRGWVSDDSDNYVDTTNNKIIIRGIDPLYISTGVEMLASENFVIDIEVNAITVPTGGRQDSLIFSSKGDHAYPDDPSNTNWFNFIKLSDSGSVIKLGADNGSLDEVDSNIVALPTADTWYWYRFTRNGTTCTCSRYTSSANRDSDTSAATATTSSMPTTWTDSYIMKYFNFSGYVSNPDFDVRNIVLYRGVTSV